MDANREKLWRVLGKVDASEGRRSPLNPRARPLPQYSNRLVQAFEVVLDVFVEDEAASGGGGVFAWGILLVPRDVCITDQHQRRRPVVVCQHGLEGLPSSCVVEQAQQADAYASNKAFATRLAEQGFVTVRAPGGQLQSRTHTGMRLARHHFCLQRPAALVKQRARRLHHPAAIQFSPHNPYRGGDSFRALVRLANPLGLSLWSVIIEQHAAILEWLTLGALVRQRSSLLKAVITAFPSVSPPFLAVPLPSQRTVAISRSSIRSVSDFTGSPTVASRR
eukprot:SAG22_NODE_1715_length_3747_cov_2.226700_3_plen_278_part_00